MGKIEEIIKVVQQVANLHDAYESRKRDFDEAVSAKPKGQIDVNKYEQEKQRIINWEARVNREKIKLEEAQSEYNSKFEEAMELIDIVDREIALDKLLFRCSSRRAMRLSYIHSNVGEVLNVF